MYKLHTDAPCYVFTALAVQQDKSLPAITVGVGADFSAKKAALKACLEVAQIRPSLKQFLRGHQSQERINKLIKDPTLVEEVEDHALLYTVPNHLSAFSFLLLQSPTDFDFADEIDEPFSNKLTVLIEFLSSINSDLIYYNLTPPDMEKIGLFTCRVIIPDFQPIHFGAKNMRLGGKRLYELPVKLGLTDKTRTANELNPHPHPLS